MKDSHEEVLVGQFELKVLEQKALIVQMLRAKAEEHRNLGYNTTAATFRKAADMIEKGEYIQ